MWPMYGKRAPASSLLVKRRVYRLEDATKARRGRECNSHKRFTCVSGEFSEQMRE